MERPKCSVGKDLVYPFKVSNTFNLVKCLKPQHKLSSTENLAELTIITRLATDNIYDTYFDVKDVLS